MTFYIRETVMFYHSIKPVVKVWPLVAIFVCCAFNAAVTVTQYVHMSVDSNLCGCYSLQF